VAPRPTSVPATNAHHTPSHPMAPRPIALLPSVGAGGSTETSNGPPHRHHAPHTDRTGAAAARPQDTATTPQLRPPIAVPPPLLPRRSPRRSPRRRAVPPCRRAAAPPLTVAVHNAHHILPPRGSPAYVRPRHERSPHPFPPCGSPAYCVASFGRRRRVHGDEQRTTTPMAAHTTHRTPHTTHGGCDEEETETEECERATTVEGETEAPLQRSSGGD